MPVAARERERWASSLFQGRWAEGRLIDDVTAVNEAVRLENRLTMMEAAIVSNTDATVRLTEHVKEQNGRVGKLEIWRAAWGGAYAVILIAGPFVFWAMNKWAG